MTNTLFKLSIIWDEDSNKNKYLVSKSNTAATTPTSIDALEIKYSLSPHLEWISRFSWSPDGRYLASGSDDSFVVVWDSKAENFISPFKGHHGQVTGVSWSPDSRFIASSSDEGKVIIWEISSGKIIGDIQSADFDSYYSVDWSRCGKYLAIATAEGYIEIWSTEPLKKLVELENHDDFVNDAIWSPDDKTLASSSGDSTIILWDTADWTPKHVLSGHNDDINNIVWSPNGRELISCGSDGLIIIWDGIKGSRIAYLEGHTSIVRSVSISSDGRLLASKSLDNTVTFWDLGNLEILCSFDEQSSSNFGGVCFHPTLPYLVTRNDWSGVSGVLSVFEYDVEKLLPQNGQNDSVRYTTAKIALVGDSGVGKTTLGWHLAYGEYKEHPSTHGQQFWTISDLCDCGTKDVECETALWDFAGQPDYRLVHSLFLDDVDLALVLFDSSNRENPLSGPDYWLKQLNGGRTNPRRTILVGSRVDRGTPTMSCEDLSEYCEENKITGEWIFTSSKEGIGVDELLDRVRNQIPWDELPSTVTTKTFKIIKEHVLSLKEEDNSCSIWSMEGIRKDVITKVDNIKVDISEVFTSIQHLEKHGYVAVIRGSSGAKVVLLNPDVLINLASSIILEARRNIRGLGSLDEMALLKNNFNFPDIAGLEEKEREILLDATVTLFLGNKLCFREAFNNNSFLVFPSLINEKPPRGEESEYTEDVSYKVTGSVENVYPSLVVLLGYTNIFSRQNQWKNRAQYQVDDKWVCGFKLISDHRSVIELLLYYGNNTPEEIKSLFQGMFERILKRKEVEIVRYAPVSCVDCGDKLERSVIVRYQEASKGFIFCSSCGAKIDLKAADRLSSLNSERKKIIKDEKHIAEKKAKFEAALVAIKRIINYDNRNIQRPTCFISYAWGKTKNEKWVSKFAKDLRNSEIDVVFDKWHNTLGTSITKFIERIDSVDFVVAVGTREYLKKYNDNNSDPVVDAEIRLINTRLRKNRNESEKIIPVLLEGTSQLSFPPLLRDSVHVNFSDEDKYFPKLFSLLITLHGIDQDDPRIEDLDIF